MHWFSLSWKKRCLSFFTLLFWNKNKEKKKKRAQFVQNGAFQFHLALEFCYVWAVIKKIKLCLAGTHSDVEKHRGQVTGRKRGRQLLHRCQRLNKFWDHRSAQVFSFYSSDYFYVGDEKETEKSVKWRVRVYWSRKISHSCHFPVCYERQNHSRPWIMAARAAWNYCFLKLNCCWHAWNKQRY